MHQEQQDVAEFHRAMDQAILPKPGVPSRDVIALRARLVTEEFGEFIGALSGATADETIRLVLFLHGFIKSYVMGGKSPDMEGLADAIADLKYVLEGTNLAFGIDGEPVWDEVQRANMAKVGGPTDAHGKRLKPPGWIPPDIRKVLLAQGWEP